MEPLQTAFCEMTFRTKYHESTGESFQDFFSTVMELRYPADFVRVRPWGAHGDRKNDGYLPSQRKLFQCFAPTDMKPLSKCIKKITQDFEGALPHWKLFFDEWIFTHNDRKGLPGDVLELLLKLSQDHAPLKATSWGYNELLTEFKRLSPSNLMTLLGPVPGLQDMVSVSLKEVRTLLEHIALQPEQLPHDVRPVPLEKLEYNQLSNAVSTLLRAGMTRADIVKKYLRSLVDQTKHDRVADAFRQRYMELKSADVAPDDIFVELQRFVSGGGTITASQQASTLAILAFFFEVCDIFERPITSPSA